MGTVLNFAKKKRACMTIILNDGKDTMIRVTMPTKKAFESLLEARELIADADTAEVGSERLNALYELTARLLSCNLEHRNITTEYLQDEAYFEIEDMIEFFNAYLPFVNGIVEDLQKN